jgi:outer membrane protein
MVRLSLERISFVIAWIAITFNMPGSVDAANRGVRERDLTQQGRPISLAQAVSIAVNRNLRMADSRLAIVEKEHQRREAFSDFLPSISVQYEAGADRYREHVKNSFLQQNQTNVDALTGIHPSRWVKRGNPPSTGFEPDYPYRIDPFRSFTLTGTITQPFYSGGRLVNGYAYAKLAVLYSALQLEVDRQNLILEVHEAYYALLQGMKLLTVADDAVRALQAFERDALLFYQQSVKPKVDFLGAQGQLAQARVQRTQALTSIGRAKATLNFLLRNPQETPIEIVEDLHFPKNSYRIPDVYEIAAANRPEIRQTNISVQQAVALVNSAKSDVLPSGSVQLKAARLNDDWNVFDPEGNSEWSVQGILTWSFDMFRSRESVKERRASEAKYFIAREELVEQVMEEVKLAHGNMKRSESDIRDYRKAVSYRAEGFRIAQLSYRQGVATYTDVLDAQRNLSTAEGDYVMAQIGYLINRAILERRLGVLR